MPLDRETEQRFNHHARMARAEFEKKWTRMDASAVARWWDKWCAPGKTHHDRLGHILVHCTGVSPFKGNPNARPYLFD